MFSLAAKAKLRFVVSFIFVYKQFATVHKHQNETDWKICGEGSLIYHLIETQSIDPNQIEGTLQVTM
jgi:hypothetical protein